MHRDLKPDNIFINDNIYKIADFEFARIFNESLMESFVGTPLYESP
jgi:serine/threonine protein kinase